MLGAPQHPYTQSLISAVPRPDIKVERFPVVNYIEKAGTPQKHIDISTHWLGKSRDYEKVTGPLVQIKDLDMRFEVRGSIFPSQRKYFQAVKKVSFNIEQGETFGLVGESGSGKSTIARLITGLYHPTGARSCSARPS